MGEVWRVAAHGLHAGYLDDAHHHGPGHTLVARRALEDHLAVTHVDLDPACVHLGRRREPRAETLEDVVVDIRTRLLGPPQPQLVHADSADARWVPRKTPRAVKHKCGRALQEREWLGEIFQGCPRTRAVITRHEPSLRWCHSEKEVPMKFELPPLPYAKDALEPHLAETLEFHYEKHHRAYLTKLRSCSPGSRWPSARWSRSSRIGDGAVFNNAAQVWNHTFYWNSMSPKGGGTSGGRCQERDRVLVRRLRPLPVSSSSRPRSASSARATSGWCRDGRLAIRRHGGCEHRDPGRGARRRSSRATSGEHAYYLDYRHERPKYAETFIDRLANWAFVAGEPRAPARARRSSVAPGSHDLDSRVRGRRDRAGAGRGDSLPAPAGTGRAQTRRGERRRRYRRGRPLAPPLLDANPAPLVVIDHESHVLLWSRAAEELFGWPEREVLGLPVPTITADKLPEWRRIRDVVVAGNSVYGLESHAGARATGASSAWRSRPCRSGVRSCWRSGR